MINHTDFIAEEDYKTTELLGWLYQFYIAERKDEVFASFKKGKKAEADDIAPATQIFTPNWIVKYMVQNTVGRIYMDNNPGTDLGEKMPYLVERTHGNNAETFTYTQLEDLRVIDPACGSGHILLEAFDLLYEMYLDEFYSREEAITAIFEHNLVGIDLDSRARQLATFALLLKACQRTDYFLEAPALPQVLDMEQLIPSFYGSMRERLAELLCIEKAEVLDELLAAYELMEQAGSLGSIMRFDIGSETRELIAHAVAEHGDSANEDLQELLPGFKLILALTRKYAAVVANPPYMGAGNMNTVLSGYVKKNYEEGKSDLFSVFMVLAENLLAQNGKYGMINMQSWMFLSSFEKLRTHLLSQLHIDSMLHLGPRTFDELSGEVVQNTAFVISKHTPLEDGGTYYRLVDGNNCHEKDLLFLNKCNCYKHIPQRKFLKITGKTISYWIPDALYSLIIASSKSKDALKARHGLLTGNDALYLRLWYEVNFKYIGFDAETFEDIEVSGKTYFPMNKGGESRKWYGNNATIVRLKNCISNFNNNKLGEKELFFREGITWTEITSKPYNRYSPTGILFGHKGATAYFKDHNSLLKYLGYSNSCVFRKLKELLFTGMSFTAGNMEGIPYESKKNNIPIKFIESNILISRKDWDAHETSWDFERNELLSIDESTYESNKAYLEACGDDRICKEDLEEVEQKYKFRTNMPLYGSLAWRMQQYKLKWEQKFMQLHANEEELNRQFIDIYGLQEELTPDVPFNEITILQQDEISIEED